MKPTRREFLRRSALAGAVVTVPYIWTSHAARAADDSSGLRLAAIGVGGSRGRYHQGTWDSMAAAQYAKMVAVCDVDEVHNAEFNAKFDNKLNCYRDYRELLDKEKPDVVVIGTPDHWHVPIAIRALKAGCDVYCEKPLTLTIEEGFRIRDAVQKSGRVFQVGTQQRSDYDGRFLKAIAVVQSGRLGKNVKAYVAIGGGLVGGPFAVQPVLEGLDWDMWLGPTQSAEYTDERRRMFRWYYDYSGGKMTDWGAHHIDIAQWALGHENSGPVSVSGKGEFTPLVPEHFDWAAYFAGRAKLPDGYQTATKFGVDLQYADGALIHVCDEYERGDGRTKFGNGILFEGDEGRIFVNRERLSGRPVEDLSEADRKELDDRIVALYKGQQPGSHMRNFFHCVETREEPVADVATHHRTMTACHLCNIALMVGHDLNWDPNGERFVDDPQATALMTRPRREPYSLSATT